MALPSKRKHDGKAGAHNFCHTNDGSPMNTFHQCCFSDGLVGVVGHALSFLNVTELVEKKQVCKKWNQLCTQAIDSKCTSPKNFKTNVELKRTVKDYCSNEPKKIEKIAIIYGYPINKWKVQDLEDFSYAFECQGNFNEYIGDWDLSKAQTMRSMFYFARAFNQPLPWNTSNVTDMQYMFYEASSFNNPLPWDTSNVTNMNGAFAFANSFNQALPWDTRRVTDMNSIFRHASSFNQPLPWITSNVTNMDLMFCGAICFNQSLGSWDTSNLTSIITMFYNAQAFDQPFNTWDSSKIVNMAGAFYNAKSFNQSLKSWVFHNDVFTRGMLHGASSYNQELPDALDPHVVFAP